MVSKTSKMRTLVIGDIHGSLRALKQCLERANYNQETDKLVFLGDYLDGWSENVEVILFLCTLKNSEFIMGNHDEGIAEWLITGIDSLMTDATTKRQFIQSAALVNPDVKKFFSNLKLYYIDENNRGYVHGGFCSEDGLGHEANKVTYYWDRDMWTKAYTTVADLQPAPKMLTHQLEIFIGHTPTINWYDKGKAIDVPINAHNVWNIDTGCGWGEKLTIIDAETKEYWQSDRTKELHPDEKGR